MRGAGSGICRSRCPGGVGVGAVPGSAFFHENITQYMRLHFAKNRETLEEALGRLQGIYQKMPVKK